MVTNNEYYIDDVMAPTSCTDVDGDSYCLKITITNESDFKQIPFRQSMMLDDLPLVSKSNGLRNLGNILTLDTGLES